MKTKSKLAAHQRAFRNNPEPRRRAKRNSGLFNYVLLDYETGCYAATATARNITELWKTVPSLVPDGSYWMIGNDNRPEILAHLRVEGGKVFHPKSGEQALLIQAVWDRLQP